MKIAAISDTHGRDGWMTPDCDVFIHAGDITAGGSRTETKKFARHLKFGLDNNFFRYAIIVPGNHDRCFDKQQDEALGFFDDPRIHVLINQGVEIEGKTFWGSPFTPPFCDWYFMAEEDRLREMYKDIPAALDVLITHGPPYNILDPGHDGSHVGSVALYEAVKLRDIKHHVFGHLHSAGGMHSCITFQDTRKTIEPTYFYNLAAVDEAYNLRRGCKIIEL